MPRKPLPLVDVARTYWASRLRALPPGRTVEVWLTPRRALSSRRVPIGVVVGTYDGTIELKDFAEDVLHAEHHRW